MNRKTKLFYPVKDVAPRAIELFRVWNTIDWEQASAHVQEGFLDEADDEMIRANNPSDPEFWIKEKRDQRRPVTQQRADRAA